MAKKKKAEAVIYVGPAFRNSRFKTYSVYKDGIPEDASDTEKRLFVSIGQLEEARKALNTKGSALRYFYDQLVNEHKGVK